MPIKMPQLVWLITGCTSGFGEEFTHQILARGDRVIATGRALEKLKHLEKEGAAILQLDVTAKQEVLDNTISEALKIYGRIDVLVNNAAYVAAGTWEDLTYESMVAQFDTNVFGVVKVTKALLPFFRQKRSGTIVNISSLSGWIGAPFSGAYSGSKFALEGLAESLVGEVSSFGIKTLLVEPGMFRTKLLSSNNLKTVQSNIPDYQKLSEDRNKWFSENSEAQPGDVSKAISIILDAVRQEGWAANREVPFRLPLGPDAYNVLKTKSEQTLELLNDLGPVINSTNYTN
ncbi:hypothetical protein F5884DRAFT_807711 [Xylogone sp. PMI_703]|nr:hypothetical protein F5884DRAFT_807711 [Xylogone sp. PMI_703]